MSGGEEPTVADRLAQFQREVQRARGACCAKHRKEQMAWAAEGLDHWLKGEIDRVDRTPSIAG
ncbi:hypothetical protein SEA_REDWATTLEHOG_60 [Gordonia phage RedWattleHog]|uniref:Uncharacterized protein n=1 Tax=Gordonia phage Stormageddon TaxID=2656541 RepID=A0A649VQY2_9CAUD|nr:hypothetical protein KHQ86_gp057 [Gordonia phage Stormageddon]QGJ94920.1 hypothetical protein SEA_STORMAGEDDON_57 [Gordonia phage Stormageddon]QLF83564.1 hypothetical protein SEA_REDWATTLEHOG_60 [Gordonia phage RedWattleHog]